jgi:hypothetical protein
MEGGYLPWKAQKITDNSPSLDYFSKSLPTPPPGQFWQREADGSWQLLKLSENNIDLDSGRVKFSQPSIIEHILLPGDSLQSLCLQYGASATEIRRMNVFSGNNIHFKTSLLIPIAMGAAIQPQVQTNEVRLQRFLNEATRADHSLSVVEARLYLDDHKWDLDRALAAWRSDSSWEQGQTVSTSFSKEIIEEEIVAPRAITGAKMVAPLAVRLERPTEQEMAVFRSNLSGNTIDDAVSTTPLMANF